VAAPATVAGDEDDEMARDLLTIGEFARASGLTPKALRLYDDLGLLPPADVDPHSGYRRYAPAQLDGARLVATLRLVGMPLARIRDVLAAPPARAAEQVVAYWRQVEADTTARRRIVATLVEQLQTEETAMPTTTDTLTPRTGVSHHQGARDRQQDAVVATRDTFAVADGTGPRDDVAELALRTFVDEGYAAAATAVWPATAEGAGTTLTAVQLVGSTARITHVGDARVHLVRDGEVRRLTADHTIVAGLIESGDLTEEEARSHPHRLLLNRALVPGTEPDRHEADVLPGDRLVLTTDGVHATLDAPELDALLLSPGTPDDVAAAIGAAVTTAGEPDNHTALVVDLAGG
jgi:serine/threonine protein phosphatase PrpC